MASYPAVSLSATLADATGLKKTVWDKILQMRAVPEDIFFTNGGTYNDKLKAIPNGIYLKAPAGMSGAYNAIFPLLMPLSSDPGMGTGTDPITNAEQQSERQYTAYYNDYDKSVKSTAMGIEYIEGKDYGLLEKVTEQIGTFVKEMFGYWVRYAMINGYSPNLLATPTSLSVVPHPNVLVKGQTFAMQPSERYSSTSNTMASIIASEIALLSNAAAGALDLGAVLGTLSYFTNTKPLTPIVKGGEKILIFTVPTSQSDYFINSANTDGGGAVWQATSRFNGNAAVDFPCYLGTIRNGVLVQDPRAPRVKAYGTAASGSQAASSVNRVYVDEYLKPGFQDSRTGLGDTSAEACFILGAGAYADLEPEPVHYENEAQYLGKLVIKGALGSRGFNRVDFEKSTATTTSKINMSSGILYCGFQGNSFT